MYDDGDGYGGSGGAGVAADTLSTAILAEAVASFAIIDIAAPADGVVGAAVIGDLLYDLTHHHCCFWVHMEHLMMIARYALGMIVCLGHILHLRMMQMGLTTVGEGVGWCWSRIWWAWWLVLLRE